MTFWNLYFILKLYLFAAGHLKPLWIANLGFALALALSAPARRRGVRLLRTRSRSPRVWPPPSTCT